ncbi:lactonase family protein [Devriesea agamarum]|uniref:lactonase family protein n=1 Tax=Devriesea agamarum TaxID=472569 RepID=UPI00071D514B|nr:beta-propeller fold lactonase family protein [Devriesea agamarum]
MDTLVATGCYTTATGGRGKGIGLWKLDSDALALRLLGYVEADSPSFLAWHPTLPVLYAVHETAPTQVSAFRLVGEDSDTPSLESTGTLTLSGEGGCHIVVGPRAQTVIISEYTSGMVETISLTEDGSLGDVIDVDDHHSYGRTRTPHPHQCILMPGTGDKRFLVSDLGLDRLFSYEQAGDGHIEMTGEIVLERGSGPRHVAADHESGNLYVACELDGTLVTVRRDVEHVSEAVWPRVEPTYSVVSRIPASSVSGPNAVSHIQVSQRENFVLVANRGPDSLSAFSLGGMIPEHVSEIGVGASPRHFAHVEDLVLVAAQEADRIDLVRWSRDGELEIAADPVPSPSVTCIAPKLRA